MAFSIVDWQEIESLAVINQSELIISSYEALLGKSLQGVNKARDLYEADFVVLSHDGGDDPCFTYANRKAQELWELNWYDFQGMPSRYSAEIDERNSRSEMLQEAMRKGYFENYRGVRISSQGQRFFIENAIIFNLLDSEKHKVGQAAVFSDWQMVDS